MADPSQINSLQRFDAAMSELVEAFQQRPLPSVLRRRARHAARMRHYRQRQAEGLLSITTDFSLEEVARLHRLHYLADHELEDRAAIARALHDLIGNIILDT
jgi:hypothetical protein